ETARASRKDGSSWDDDSAVNVKAEATKFVGYNSLNAESEIVALVCGNAEVDAIGAGEEGIVIVKESPFYAEMGGQAGDKGEITTKNGKAKVVDTKKNGDDVYFHIVAVEEGSLSKGDIASLSVCKKNRMAICRNHSTTHLLHKALKEVLGSHVAQAGSEVTSKHLRFDFSHFEAMTNDEIKLVEKKVNDAILEAMPINVQELDIEEAKKLGATAQFGEKYKDVVRVVSMGDYSIEFCGGTHLTNTAQAGLFKIVSENGVAAGVRRIEALTGAGVLEYIKSKDEIIERTATVLKTNLLNEIDKKAESVTTELKTLQKEIESLKAKAANEKANDILSQIKNIGGVDVLSAYISGMSADDLKTTADGIKEKYPCSAVVLASDAEDKITFVAMATKDAVSKGVHAGNIIREITAIAGGKGGGKPDMAQGGGKDKDKIAEAVEKAEEIIKAQIG
ncbi:MAG: alanine--tRNA ligase, partial [Clostridia bacterium]|nr:alanine--tRNA ligase [Clostridia bacterium]